MPATKYINIGMPATNTAVPISGSTSTNAAMINDIAKVRLNGVIILPASIFAPKKDADITIPTILAISDG